MVKLMCEACLAHQDAQLLGYPEVGGDIPPPHSRDYKTDQSISSGSLRLLDAKIREASRRIEMSNAPNAQPPLQDATVGNSIADVQGAIDELLQAVDTLSTTVEPVSQGEIPSTSADEGKAQPAIKYIAELMYIKERIRTATSRVIDINTRLRL